MTRQKKTIIKKKNETGQKERLRAKVRLPKNENEPMKSKSSESITNIADLLAQAIETSVQKSTLAHVQDKEKEVQKLKEDNEKEIEKLKDKLSIAITKYRTKYMEMSHYKQQSKKKEMALINIIENLKVELVKYSPDNEIFSTIEKILEITNENHVARKKSLKM